MANTSDLIATTALVVSILSAGFSVYQWDQSERESKIVAAIDVSRKYVEDKDISATLRELRKKPDFPARLQIAYFIDSTISRISPMLGA
jgi:hypothetical protein